MKKGFTLLELLVVVLIIGILAAVAVPQYQKAVLKSRFSKLMPAAKSLATANEVFYLANGFYSQRPHQLDVGSDTDNLPDGSRILLSDDDIVSFVRLSNTDVPNARYVVYQKHSVNFADTTMCEAQKDDEKAKWICEKGLNGQPVEVGNSGGERDWKAYLLTGTASNQDHFGEIASDGCTYAVPADITTSYNRTGTATCVNGKWKYTWSGSGITDYNTNYSSLTTVCLAGSGNTYKCAGNIFSGTNTKCQANGSKSCVGSIFSGAGSFCDAHGAKACADSTFSGNGAQCLANSSNQCEDTIISGPNATCSAKSIDGCAGSIVSGNKARCFGSGASGCSNAQILAGGYCQPFVDSGCNGALYGANPGKNSNLLGSCYDVNSRCPTGVPVTNASTDWNSTTQAYNYTWKGNCCNPKYMVSGECPANIDICE